MSSDLNSIRYNLDWQISPQFKFLSNGTSDQGANFNIQYSAGGANSSTLAIVSVNTDRQLGWSLAQRLDKLYFTHRGNTVSTFSQLSYQLNPYQSLFLNYQTLSSSNNANLLTAYWSYSPHFAPQLSHGVRVGCGSRVVERATKKLKYKCLNDRPSKHQPHQIPAVSCWLLTGRFRGAIESKTLGEKVR